ncbi:hypothetical protein EB796_003869 [Bugula neritina]|uniref:EF-hand domain-containing protein n=1 Tax=Bugula neritina TaxID=10212 RepID=A0A7J7KGV7_BUGNE|nr:hypothetical protein EB796_003869 [Bugula neritina]
MGEPLINSKKGQLQHQQSVTKPPQLSILKNKDAEANIMDHIALTRYKPVSLHSLVESTKFTKREIQIMYRGFKQECPTGIVNEETFKYVYAQFFPQGDSSSYSHYVFNAMDKAKHGCITFEEFLQCLSELIYGSIDDKLRWAFSLYDQDGDGEISRDELAAVITAVYDMMGAKTSPPIDQYTVDQHVNAILAKADEGSEKISYGSFVNLCMKDHQPASTFNEFATDLRLRD